jgi:vitamin B12 transporter
MKYLFLLGCSLAIAVPAWAQGTVADDEANICAGDCMTRRSRDDAQTILVTGTPLNIYAAGQSLSITTLAELHSVQGPDLIRTLERLPGVTAVRNGGQGGFTGLFVRGASSDQALVLLDGVRMSDVAAPGGGYDLGNMLSGGIGKVELLRGSNSVVWGSRAIGGVLALTSREMRGAEVSAEYGSHDSVSAEAVAGFGSDRANLTLSAGYLRTDGISAAASGSEADPFRQWRIAGRARADLGGGFSASLTGRYADSRLDIDGFPAPLYNFADTPEYSTSREASGRAQLGWQGNGLNLAAGFAIIDNARANFDPTFGSAPGFDAKGRSERVDLSGKADIAPGLALTFGADSEWNRYSTTYDAEKQDRLASGHALLSYAPGALNLSAGLRIDDHSRFGSAWTFGANGSVTIAGDLRLRASYGEGFKAPTLSQLFSDYGNQALQPERSRSFDIGIEKGDRNNGGLHASLTLFRRDSRDLIDFVSCFGVTGGICAGRPFGTYNNVGRARAEGIEAELGARLTDRLKAGAVYSYVKATNRANGKDLARRPRHALTLSTDWRTPLHSLTLGANLRVLSARFDDAGNSNRLPGYTLVTLRASLPVSEMIELFGRIENVADERYQTVAGYGAYGRTAALGARARF